MAKKSKKDKEIEKKWKGKTGFKIGFKSLRGALRQKLSNMGKEAEYPEFSLKRPSHLVVLPALKKIVGLDIKYPLLEPLAYANIKWVPEKRGLVYFIHEPELAPEEKELLEKIKSDLRELIDVEISVIEKRKEAIDYIEGKLKTILAETGINLPKETYIKIVYYIIRDFVGLNEIEPLMNDPYIEDVGCDGLGMPIYIVHRKFGSVETGITYRDMDYLNNFVIKLAERCGRYVSYAKPLMDGTLPDGSRVQVSIAKDVTTKGPTFSIRKFQASPFSPVELIDLKTASPELMAYLWLAVQHSTSILICGGVATGKCISPGDYVQLADGEILEAEQLHKRAVNQGKPLELLTLSNNPLKMEPARVNKFWKLHSDTLLSVKTKRGIGISTTPEHPFLCMRFGKLERIRADMLREGDWVASVRYLPIKGKPQPINLLDYDSALYARGAQGLVKKMLRKIDKSLIKISRELGVEYQTLREWKKRNAIPLKKLRMLAELSGYGIKRVSREIKSISVVKSRKDIRNITKTSPGLAKIVGYVMADGNMYGREANFHNSSPELRNDFIRELERVFGINAKTSFQKNRTPRVNANSLAVAEVLNKVFGIPRGRKARKISVPVLLMKSSLKELSCFLRALFDCESYVSNKECEIEFSTASKRFAMQLPYLFQRFGITARVSAKSVRGEKYYRIRISGSEDLKRFSRMIGYTHPDKKGRLRHILKKTKNYSTNVDIIPVNMLIRKLHIKNGINNSQLAVHSGLKRESIRDIVNGKVNPSRETLKKIVRGFEILTKDKRINYLSFLANSDIFWDRIESIEEKINRKGFVYDVTVDGTHNFVAGNFGSLIISNTTFLNCITMFIPPEDKIVSIEDTRELNIPHQNWIPSVARVGFGVPEASGMRYGEVSLFELLKESFRQNPDYVIVGEVRGKEAYVMFQGMSSGHPCVGTIHAGSVDDVIKRLETPPIELSTSLVETLDLIIVMVHSKERGKSARRVKEVVEMISVDSKTGRAHTLRSFVWVPSNDSHESNVMESRLLRRISFQKGIPYAKIMEELKKRKNVLEWMLNYGITDFEDICKLINLYYKEPSTIMKWVNNNTPPYKTKYKGKIKKLWESATGLKIIKEEADS